ncbi:MAG: pitrilysin family protein [Thermaerobacter sp.]|nr:pitrilysin family protein [Thermaerobacter sp.]
MTSGGYTEDGFVGEFQNGIGWYCYPTPRFKTITLHAFWINELTPQDAAKGALLPHVLRRGTRRWPSLVAIERELEELYGASFRAEVGKVADKQLLSMHLEVINGRFLPGHPDTLRQALDFLSEVSSDPHLGPDGFDPGIVQQEKILLKRQIQALINDKGQYAMSRLVEILADGRRFGLRKLGTIADVENITGSELLDYYQSVKTTLPSLLFVVGDVDPSRIEDYVHKQWQGFRQPLTPIIPFVPRHDGQEVIERQAVRQGKVNMGFGTGISAADPQYPALMMYAGVLGGFPHSKLFVNVREKHSLAYYAFARLDAPLALMVIGAGIEFDDYSAVRRIIDQQLEAMQAGAISAEEMAFTLKAFCNDILSEEDSPSQIVGRQLEHVLVGNGMTGRRLMQALERVTISDIQAVAEKIRLDTVHFLTADGEGQGEAQDG